MSDEVSLQGQQQNKKRRFLRPALTALGALIVGGALLFYFRPLLVVAEVQRAAEWKLGLAEHNVQLGHYRIRYLAGGTGKPLVLVHGLAGRAEDWLAIVPALRSAGYRIYALDLLGYGRSDKPDVDYSISLESEILGQFIESQHLEKPDVAGWSMGGWIAAKFAADNPGRVRRLVLLDSAGMKFDAVNAAALRPKTEADLAHMMRVLTPHPMHVPSFYAQDFLRHFAEEDWIVSRALNSMYTGKDLLDGKLGAVKVPVLLVWGKEDVLTPPSIGEQMRQEMPQSFLYLVDGCGHLAPVECSKPVGAEMVKFLSADPPLEPGKQTIATMMAFTNAICHTKMAIMRLTLDKAGRVVLPKTVRDELLLQPGDALELETSGEDITLRPVRGEVPLRKKNGVWVYRAGEALSAKTVDKTLSEIRREREIRNLSAEK